MTGRAYFWLVPTGSNYKFIPKRDQSTSRKGQQNKDEYICNVAVGMTEAGFPMSSFLSEHGCQIGRNARMLASHSPPRTASSKQASMFVVTLSLECN